MTDRTTNTATLRDFWGAEGAKVHWFKPPEQVLDDSNPPFFRWFPDGITNVAYNAVDRHVASGHGQKVALIYDSAYTGAKQRISFAQYQT